MNTRSLRLPAAERVEILQARLRNLELQYAPSRVKWSCEDALREALQELQGRKQ